MGRLFGGGTDRSEVAASATTNNLAAFTCIQFIRPGATPAGQSYRKGPSGVFTNGTTGDCFVTVGLSTTQARADTNTTPFPANTWAYRVHTWDIAAAAPRLNMYRVTPAGVISTVASSNSGVGSSNDGSGTQTGAGGDDSGSATGLGGRPAGAGTGFAGDMAVSAVFSRVLTQNEIIGFCLKRVLPGNCAYWIEHGLTGTTDIDISGNGNHGTVTGTTIANHGPGPNPYAASGRTIAATGTVTATPAIVFTTNAPATVTPSVAISPSIVVKMTTDGSTTDTSFAGNVTATWTSSNEYGSIGGTVTVAAVAGVATFSNLVPSNTEGGPFTLTFSAAGVSDLVSSSFLVVGSIIGDAVTFIAANGGNANWTQWNDLRVNVSVATGASTVKDAIGSYGGRTPGPDITQATGTNQPAVSGTRGASSYLVFDGVDNYMTSAASANHKQTGSTGTPNPQHCFALVRPLADGPMFGLAADETNSATSPFMMVNPASGDWAASISSDGTGVSGHKVGTATPNLAQDYSATDWRLVWIGKDGWDTGGDVGDDTNIEGVYKFAIAGLPPMRHGRMTDATNSNEKIVWGRHGASYGTFEMKWFGKYVGEWSGAKWDALRSHLESTFGITVGGRSSYPTFISQGNSLWQGDSNTDELRAVNTSGTNTVAYVAAHRNSGARGTLLTQLPLMTNVHQYNAARNGDTVVKMIRWFDRDISIYKEAIRTGRVVNVHYEVSNALFQYAYNLSQLLAQYATYYTAHANRGIKLALCTVGDRDGFHDAGRTALTTIGTVATNFNATITDPSAIGVYCDYVIDIAASPLFAITASGAAPCDNLTYYADKVHLTDAGSSEQGILVKAALDANNDAILWGAAAGGANSYAARRRRRGFVVR